MIRRATIKDIPAINHLGEQLHTNFSRLFHMETEIDSSIAIVLVNEDSNVNAYLYALDLGDNIDLLSIFVDNNSRHKHIGSNMIIFLQQIANNKTITLEVSSKNEAAINLYTSMGFKIVATREKYYETSDAYIMKWGII